MNVPDYFLAGIGLGVALYALGYLLLCIAIVISFAVHVSIETVRERWAARRG
jgi:hypothetical protein